MIGFNNPAGIKVPVVTAIAVSAKFRRAEVGATFFDRLTLQNPPADAANDSLGIFSIRCQ